MIHLLTKLRSASHNRTSYRVGLLQAKAYRILKQKTNLVLAPYGITATDWALLGLLSDKQTLRMSHVAEELGVEPPFVSEMVKQLQKKHLITLVKDTTDTRVKGMSLTPEGVLFVSTTEPVVRASMRPLIGSASMRDILGYLSVLEHIVNNDSKDN